MTNKLTSLTGFGEGDPKPEKMDKQRRWGNSAMKGHGVNSPAMMEARAGFAKGAKAKALSKKMGKSDGKLFDRKFRTDKSRGIYAGKSLEAAMSYEERRKARDA